MPITHTCKHTQTVQETENQNIHIVARPTQLRTIIKPCDDQSSSIKQ